VSSDARRGGLTRRAYEHVREAILRGEFPVGSALAEDELAAQVGSSRTPVRHALQLLLQEGLLEVGPRRQLVVRELSSHREEILAVREALESVAVRRACEVMALDEMDELRLLLMRQRRAAEAGLEDEFIDLDEQFHLRIAEGARLPILHRFLSQIRGFVRVMQPGAHRGRDELLAVLREHEEIIDALEERDAAAALDVLVTHLHTRTYAPTRQPGATA